MRKRKWTDEDMLACKTLEELEGLYGDQAYYGEVMDGYMDQYAEVFDQYVSNSDDVAEFGVHRCASSTFLLRRCKNLHSWEISRKHFEAHRALMRLAEGRWTLNYGSSLTSALPAVDVLFIDSSHTYGCMQAELHYASVRVSQHIILHDTTTSWWIGHANTKGIGPAVREFLEATPTWREEERFWPAPGMMVLSRA